MRAFQGGFLITDNHGGEDSRALVDVQLFDPEGHVIYDRQGIADGRFRLEVQAPRGPYKMCFKISRANPILRPSVRTNRIGALYVRGTLTGEDKCR